MDKLEEIKARYEGLHEFHNRLIPDEDHAWLISEVERLREEIDQIYKDQAGASI